MENMRLSVAITLAVLAIGVGREAQANDIQKALNLVKGKINGNGATTGQPGVGNFTLPNTTNPNGLTSPTTGNTGSIKSLLQQAAQKVSGSNTLPATSAPLGSPATVLTNPTTGLPLVPQNQPTLGKDPQSVKVKVGKEILRQATKYNSKHPNKLVGKGINELNRVINK